MSSSVWFNFSKYSSKAFTKKKLVIGLSMRAFTKNCKITLRNKFLKLYSEMNEVRI